MRTLLLIDANALIHRSFHALPPFTNAEGMAVGALYGLANVLLKIAREEPPDYAAVLFDRPEPTFRKKMFKEYKAHRPPAPNDLISQIIEAHNLFQEFGIKIFEQPGLEADDLIGILSEKFKNEPDVKIMILTGDLDALQLVCGDKVVVKTLRKGISDTVIYNENAVKERYDLLPSQLVDYKSLVGDQSDNIPGVPGIGPKTASRLINKFGGLEDIFEKAEKDSGLVLTAEKKMLDKLLAYKEQVVLAKKLASIERQGDIGVKLEDLAYQKPQFEKLKQYFQKLGFQSLIARLEKENQSEKPETSSEYSKYNPNSSDLFADSDENSEDSHRSIGFNFKDRLKVGEKLNMPFFDLGVAAWLIDPDLKDYSPENLAKKFLKKELSGEQEIVRQLFPVLKKKSEEYSLEKIFQEIEMPLIPVLADMENAGIKIDKKVLEGLSLEINGEIKSLEEKIYQEAGERFNLNSPKQMLALLNRRFNLKLNSTAAEKLESLKEKLPLLGLILDYRENFKIKSTYIEPILRLTGADGRLRTTFNQTAAATGRLSSSEPNLQNIPQESKWSGRLRSAFVAEEGFQLASFDYSQLELRILASVSGDKKMQDAFKAGQDIHKLTAAQVFNVPLERVTVEMRRLGKTLNFGVVYGMGADAFSRGSGLKKEEARRFISEYFADFPQIKIWQEEVIRQAGTSGYVANLNGRRRWLFNIADFNQRVKAEAERIAVNMPIQGLGADIIKLAMIKTSEFLKTEKLIPDKARLLLSIHDELLFEISDGILKETAAEIKKIMESVYSLTVPLVVDSAAGKNWRELR